MPQINENQNLVAGSIGNLANAHEAMANADLSDMQAAGQIASTVGKTATAFQKEVALQKYYEQRNWANNIITGASTQAVNAAEQYKGANDLQSLDQVHNAYVNMQDGIAQQLKKTPLAPTIQSGLEQKLAKFQDVAGAEYLKRKGTIADNNLYRNFTQSVGSISMSAGENIPDMQDMSSSAGQLLNSPYLNETQKRYVQNALTNMRMLDNSKANQSGSEAVAAPLDHSLTMQNEQSWQGEQKAIENYFLNGHKYLAAANTNLGSIQPSKFQTLLSRQDALQQAYGVLSNSKNLMDTLTYGTTEGGLPSQVSNVLLKRINKDQGDVVARGLSGVVKNAFDAFRTEQTPEAYREYQTALQSWASSKGVPMSKMGNFDPGTTAKIDQLDATAKTNPNYGHALATILHQSTAVQVEGAIPGSSHQAQVARMYYYGNSKDPQFSNWLTATNADKQDEIAKRFNAAPDKDDLKENKEHVQNILDDYQGQIEQLAKINQVSYNNMFATSRAYLQDQINRGVDRSNAEANLGKLLGGYINNGRTAVGSNYILPQDTLNKYNITPDNAGVATDQVLSTVRNQFIKNYIAQNVHKYGDAGTAKLHADVAFGSTHDYTLVQSNGNLYAQNNLTGHQYPVSPPLLQAVSDQVNPLAAAQRAGRSADREWAPGAPLSLKQAEAIRIK